VTDQQSGKISRAEMTKALLRSGYLLESRVESKLRKQWGYVEANPTYIDPDTGKSREFDLEALTVQQAGPSEYDFSFALLVAECINNPQPLVIMTKEPLVPFLHHEEVKIAGLPVKVQNKHEPEGWERLSDFLGMENYHHYCKGRIGTQFCSFARKKGGRVDEWMATHEGAHYDSFRKVCDVVDYHVQKNFTNWTFGGEENVNIEIYYPVIILQGELLEARETKRSVTLRSAEHLQFRRSMAMKGTSVDYQIDVIRERHLLKYLELVDGELEKTARLLRRRHKAVRSAIDRIVAAAKGVTDPEQKRNIMDYAR
jgi:hypothetical protein